MYDHFWPFAEVTGTGTLGGPAVVAFMSKTGLDKSVLRQVWAAANLRSGPALNKFEFYVAMRLIQLAQAGQPVSREAVVLTSTTPLPPPRFEGVPPPPAPASMPAPSAPAAAFDSFGAGMGAGAGDRRASFAAMGAMPMPAPPSPWSITAAEAARYDAVFRAEDTDGDGRITGQQAVALLSRSGLDKAVRVFAPPTLHSVSHSAVTLCLYCTLSLAHSLPRSLTHSLPRFFAGAEAHLGAVGHGPGRPAGQRRNRRCPAHGGVRGGAGPAAPRRGPTCACRAGSREQGAPAHRPRRCAGPCACWLCVRWCISRNAALSRSFWRPSCGCRPGSQRTTSRHASCSCCAACTDRVRSPCSRQHWRQYVAGGRLVLPGRGCRSCRCWCRIAWRA